MSSRIRRKKKGRPIVDLYCRYTVVQEALELQGFSIPAIPEGQALPDATYHNLLWSDLSVTVERIKKFANWQRCNHFPHMHLLSQKMYLCQTLRKMYNWLPLMYDFFPKSWSLRSDRTLLRTHCAAHKYRTYIVKPNGGCQGKGIILTKDPFNADLDAATDYVVQEYIKSPLLIEGKKFDMRVYVLITNIRLPSVFVFTEGLIRICAESYAKPKKRNLGNACVHLTNYAVNKRHEKFEAPTATTATATEGDDCEEDENEGPQDGGTGNKRDFAWFNRWLTESGHNTCVLWQKIDEIVAKSILAAQPQVEQAYNVCFPHHNDGFSCFEILGFDILVDSKIKPWLIEINHSPNLTCDAPLDHRVKLSMLQDAIRIVHIRHDDKQAAAQRESLGHLAGPSNKSELHAKWSEEKLVFENDHLGGYRRVLPTPNPDLQPMYAEIQQTAMSARMAGVLPRRRMSSSQGMQCEHSTASPINDVKPEL